MTQDQSPLIEVTDEAEIASIRRNQLPDIIGGVVDGRYYAYAWSLERWRKGRAASPTNHVGAEP